MAQINGLYGLGTAVCTWCGRGAGVVRLLCGRFAGVVWPCCGCGSVLFCVVVLSLAGWNAAVTGLPASLVANMLGLLACLTAWLAVWLAGSVPVLSGCVAAWLLVCLALWLHAVG